MWSSDLCNYSLAYIVVKERISVTVTDAANRRNKKVTFKNNASFRLCVSKINDTLVYNAEDLDVVIPVYNLSEYSEIYSMTSWSLRNFIEMKETVLLMKIMIQIIIEQITTKQQQINLLSIWQN